MFYERLIDVRGADIPFTLVGNKCDETHKREVSEEEGVERARRYGCEFLETSAKADINVGRLFADLVRVLRQKNPSAVQVPSTGRRNKTKGGCRIL
jgi:GTPase KRas protein